ncbi:hypothetical protein SPAR_21817 [Streptomyces sparsogenes DSM 40356]|uniref:Uncharacterized protein n=1 Tax=Streptomyces sparsogenes DSM 40356 TaxID=1331668 RepID=A0A1R1SGD7_9ACTN|nr:hypothetical protein SPAR_21817 [Streptomyces sparsogenes DSM 40356]
MVRLADLAPAAVADRAGEPVAGQFWSTWDRRERVSALFSGSITGVRPMLQLCETSRATRETSRPSMRVRRSETCPKESRRRSSAPC